MNLPAPNLCRGAKLNPGRLRRILAFAGLLASVFWMCPGAGAAGSSGLVIAEVYGGGGNGGSLYSNDFVVVFNRGVANVDVGWWSVQYAAAASASWQMAVLATNSTIIPPGGYFLLKLSAGAGGTSALPAVDASASINLSATAGKVALCNTNIALTGATPANNSIIDLVGYGSSVSANEGSLSAPAPGNTTSIQRGNFGCTDTDFNATDFTTGSPFPRNSSSVGHPCAGDPPTLLAQPQGQTNLLTTSVSLRVTALSDTPPSYRWRRNGVDLSDGGQFSGTGTDSLTISNLVGTNAGDYTVVVTNQAGPATNSPPATLALTNAGMLTHWNFNGQFNPTAPVSTLGSSTATAVLAGGLSGFINPVSNPNDPGAGNYSWGTQDYPAPGTSNKTAGPRFNVSTAGLKNISISYDLRASATASRYQRLQYTTNGTVFTDFPVTSALDPNTSYQTRTFSLAGFPGVRNNPNFGFRVVTEFESSANDLFYGGSNYVGTTTGYDPNGTLSYDLVTVSAEVMTTNTPPTISSLPNVVITQSMDTGVVNCTVSDSETASGSLLVSAVSANAGLISAVGVSNGATPGARILSFTRVTNQTGVAPILVTVSDGGGESAAAWFYVVVFPDNLAPSVTQLPHASTLINVPLLLSFEIVDDLVAASNLTVTAVSGNTNVAPNPVLGGSGANRTVTINPVTNRSGVAPILITVGDGINSTVRGFSVMVRPTTNVFFNDYFDYATGPLTDGSAGRWQAHSGAGGGVVPTFDSLVLLDANYSEDVNALLIGQPYTTNGGVPLYASFKVACYTLPTSGGGYFAHFKDAHPIDETAGFGARVWASRFHAASGMYRLGIGNGESATNSSGQFPRDLELGATNLVVIRFNPAIGTDSTIWVNPSSEASASVTATDVSGVPTQPNAIDVVAFAFRQGSGQGGVYIDDLIVGRSFEDVAPVLHITKSGANVILTWANPTLTLQTALLPTGAFSNINAATSPFTNSINQPQRYFRLFKP